MASWGRSPPNPLKQVDLPPVTFLMPMVLDIARDHVCRDLVPHRPDKVPIFSKLSTLQLSAQLGKLLEERTEGAVGVW